MGIGVATGMSAGICSTVKAAQDEGIMSTEQVDVVLRRAASNMGSQLSESDPIVGSAQQCDEVMAKLKQFGG